MNTHQIECFLEAARELNFTRAAENLRLPQPAVSRYIASLESELDTKLFTRERNRKITLTEAGKAYFNLFQRTETELSLTRTILAEKPETLRLGINLSWSSSAYLPRAILRCEMQNPKFRLSYHCLDFREMTAALREKRLDAIIGLEDVVALSNRSSGIYARQQAFGITGHTIGAILSLEGLIDGILAIHHNRRILGDGRREVLKCEQISHVACHL